MTAPPFDWAAFRRGCRAAVCAGGVVLCGSFIGFGALVHASGLSVGEGVFTTISVWALPGQVVLVTMMASGAGIASIALAVALTAIRLMPIVVAVLPEVRVPGRSAWLHFLAGYLIAATVWIEARRVFPTMEKEERLPHLLGLGAVFMPVMAMLTVVGYYVADFLPPLLSASLVFLTPAYFLLGLLANARDRIDGLSMVFGAAGLVGFHMIVPDLSMMLAGLVGGTAAFLLGRRRNA